jgi:hypothetical protein
MINKFCKIKIIGGRKGGFNPPVLIFDTSLGWFAGLKRYRNKTNITTGIVN